MAETTTTQEVVEEIEVEQPIKAEEPAVEKKLTGAQRAMSGHRSGAKPEPVPADAKKYDYTVLKDLSEDDYTKYKDLKTKDEGLYFDLLSQRNDMKRYQRVNAQRESEINELKSANIPEDVVKMKEFINGMKSDAIGTYKRYQKDFDLPEPTFLEQQMKSGGSVEERIVQWQEKDLTPEIEKKFKLESGTFVYDANEAYKAGTPSYEYRLQTEKQEKALIGEYEAQVQRQATILTKVKQQNDADLKFLRETHFPDTEYAELDEHGKVKNAEEAHKKADEAFITSLNHLDEIQAKVKSGEFDAAQNPFALRVIWRGINHEQLAAKAVEKAISSLHAEYNAKGLYLKSEEGNPTDVTKLKGSSPPVGAEKQSFGASRRMMNRTIQHN